MKLISSLLLSLVSICSFQATAASYDASATALCPVYHNKKISHKEKSFKTGSIIPSGCQQVHLSVKISPTEDEGRPGAFYAGARDTNQTFSIFYSENVDARDIGIPGWHSTVQNNVMFASPIESFKDGLPSSFVKKILNGASVCSTSTMNIEIWVGYGSLSADKERLIRKLKEQQDQNNNQDLTAKRDAALNSMPEGEEKENLRKVVNKAIEGRDNVKRSPLDVEKMALSFIYMDGMKNQKYSHVMTIKCVNNTHGSAD